MRTRGGNRMAPPSPHTSGDPRRLGTDIVRGLQLAVVPNGSGDMRDLVHGISSSAQSKSANTIAGESCGPAMRMIGASCGATFASLGVYVPSTPPYTCFGFIVRRDASNTLQALCGNSVLGNGQWTFQLNYGSGQLGLTHWGSADHPTTVLGVVPTGVPSTVALAKSTTNARFMLNGALESVASGTTSSTTSTAFTLGYYGANGAPLVDSSIYVFYLWNRTLGDADLLSLNKDPWLPLRVPRRRIARTSAAVGGGSGGSVCRLGLSLAIGL